MAVTATSFKDRFPEFAAVADARVDVFLDDARAELAEAAWGDWYDKGTSYLAAHFLTVANATAGGSSGTVSPLSSVTVGDVSENYAAYLTSKSGTDAYFSATAYGQEYIRLAKQVGLGWVAVYE